MKATNNFSNFCFQTNQICTSKTISNRIKASQTVRRILMSPDL